MRWVAIALLTIFLGVSCGVEPTVACVDDSACFDGYSCDLETATCLRTCETTTVSTDCLASQFCDAPTGETVGVCRQASPNENRNGG
ncbi:MAG: hypothetical protein AAF658_15175 [Myxococcota bacterium]